MRKIVGEKGKMIALNGEMRCVADMYYPSETRRVMVLLSLVANSKQSHNPSDRNWDTREAYISSKIDM